jgi:3-hydroxyisobutyrate dehydrogenase-like beta-hydroxyacid dehydrogenase
MKVGWIGLGNIGALMAARVLGAGHELAAYARGAGQEAVASAGGKLTKDYLAVASDCDVLGVGLFSDAQVREVLFDQGVLAVLSPGAVLAVHTTGSPALARELAERAPAGVETLDACFSGGPAETSRGELVLMVGGTDEGLGRARPVLSTYANRIHHVGPAGAGQTLKLLNNLAFATNLGYAAEIMRLAQGQGLDTAAAAQVIQQSSGSSMAMSMFAGGRTPEQVLDIVRHYMVKDVQAAEAAAQALGVDFAAFAPVLARWS